MSNSKIQQQIYRSKKYLTKDFVTEECDKLLAEDVDEDIIQSVKTVLPWISQWLSPGAKINAVKVFQSFDNILTYDKGQVSRDHYWRNFEFLDISGSSSDCAEISVEDITPGSDQEQYEDGSKRLQGSCSKIEANYIPPKNIFNCNQREGSQEKIFYDKRLPSVVILQQLHEQRMRCKC